MYLHAPIKGCTLHLDCRVVYTVHLSHACTFRPQRPSSAVRLKCYRGELFISTPVVDVMTGVDGLGDK